MPALFALALFLSAVLLFVVEPMTARRVLPLLGGSPAVWNTCMVFYQAALLAGYAYAHLLSRRFSLRRQVIIHGTLVGLAFVVLPLSLGPNWQPPREANPIPWLLALLTVCIGLPFFVLSASAPLLQRWFADGGHRAARDPYFLYAASNLGSLLALASYPTVIERLLPLGPGTWQSQSWLWSAGYGFFVVLLAGCAWVVCIHGTQPADKHRLVGNLPAGSTIEPWTKVRWVALAFIPASLMLGVTNYITMDLAAIPLLWVLPLGLYLFSFVMVFAYWPTRVHAVVVRLTPAAALLVLVLMLAKFQSPSIAGFSPGAIGIGLHLLTLLLVSLACHGELARTRPPAGDLTAFYLWLSVGGVLGGLFNALVAPSIFSSVVEYPLVLVLTCFVLPASKSSAKPRPALLGGLPGFLMDLGIAIFLAASALWLGHWLAETSAHLGLAFVPSALLCCLWAGRPVRLGLSVGAIALVAASQQIFQGSESLYRERDFFGVIEVRHEPRQDTFSLWHGSTLHGQELRQPHRRSQPVAYYHSTGPIAQAFRTLPQTRGRDVAVVGLGAGCLAAFGRPGQNMTFYEIDPAMSRTAERYFHFLKECPAKWNIVLGDARLRLADAPDGHYDLIVLDAFSSDAVPVHLMTREAFEMYFRKLTPDGIIIVNITNRYLDLRPVLGNLARDLHLVGRYRRDGKSGFPLKTPSTWAVLARRPMDLSTLPNAARWTMARNELGLLMNQPGPAAVVAELFASYSGAWQDLPTNHSVGVWRDDYSNLIAVYRWRR